jgi:hypothetical protein
MLIVQDHAQQASLHDERAMVVVIDEAKFPELVHEATYP